MTQEALKLALEALEWCHGGEPCGTAEAIAAIKEALAQPEQEHVAWMTQARNFIHLSESTEAEAKVYGWKAVYTYLQRRWVGLTDEERSELVTLHHGWNEYGQAIEAKLKEKNT